MSGTVVLINLLGGIALLLWGLRMVRTGVTRAFGGDLQRVIERNLNTRLRSFAAGLGVTFVMQSSTATALLTASFAERGLVTTVVALAMLLGADVGTTLVAQVLTFDLSLLSPILLLLGLVLFSRLSAGRQRNMGRVCIGLGLMLLALRLIVESSAPVRDAGVTGSVLGALDGEPLLALLIGALLTWMAHSSLAMVLLLISLAGTGVIDLATALPLVLGANLGGALPPIVATLAAGPEARRPPLGNFLIRLAGCALALPALHLLHDPLAVAGGEVGRQIAHFHTAFNLALAVVFLPLVGPVARLTERLLPDRAEDEEGEGPRHLDPSALDTPSVALANAARETLRMGDVVEAMFNDCFAAVRGGDKILAKQVEHTDDVVDSFHEAIMGYLTELSREPLGHEDSRRCADTMTFSTNLEHIGDIIVLNVIEQARNKIRRNVTFDAADQADLERLAARIRDNMRLAFGVFMSRDVEAAGRLLEQKKAYREAELAAVDAHMERLRAGQQTPGDASSIYLDLLRDLRRINSHLTAAAYPILDAAGLLRSTRMKKRLAREVEADVAPREARPAPSSPTLAT